MSWNSEFSGTYFPEEALITPGAYKTCSFILRGGKRKGEMCCRKTNAVPACSQHSLAYQIEEFRFNNPHLIIDEE